MQSSFAGPPPLPPEFVLFRLGCRGVLFCYDDGGVGPQLCVAHGAAVPGPRLTPRTAVQ